MPNRLGRLTGCSHRGRWQFSLRVRRTSASPPAPPAVTGTQKPDPCPPRRPAASPAPPGGWPSAGSPAAATALSTTRSQDTRSQPRHDPRSKERGLARARLPRHQQYPRLVQPLLNPLHKLGDQLTAPVKDPRVVLIERNQPQVRTSLPQRAAAGCGLLAHGRQHLPRLGAAAGRRHERGAHRLGQAQRTSQAARRCLRAVRLTPRSRSLTDRGLMPAASASSSWVSLAWTRSCQQAGEP